MDYSPDHWVNSVAWGKGVGPMMSGGVEWVNAMSVVYNGAWVGGVQISVEEERSRWREMETESEERDTEKKIVK